MKTTKTIETTCCDLCGGDGYTSSCDNCGKDVCWTCKDNGELVQFNEAIHYSSSNDGDYCPDCVKALTESGNERLAAFMAIKRLKDENKAWYEDFDRRRIEAEARVAMFPKPKKGGES